MFFFQMAWESSEEQAMSVVRQHLEEEASLEVRHAIIDGLIEDIFPEPIYPNGQWKHTRWVTHDGITYVKTWGEDHLLNNLKVALMEELLGLGPHHYCILDNGLPELEKRILLLLYHLPPSKLCFYSKRGKMREISLGSPWKEIVKEIRDRDVPLDKDLAGVLSSFEQYEIWADF